MQKHTDIIKSIESGNFAPVYFLHGEEAFFIDKISDAIIEHALTEAERAFNQIILYGKEADFMNVVDNARQFPMMAQRRLIVVKEAQEMKTLVKLENYVSNPSEQSVLLIAHKYKKLDKRTKFAKALAKHAVVFESKKLYSNQVPQWISQYVSSKGKKIDTKASFLLTEYLGEDLSRITTELDKLSVNLNDSESITTKHIEEYVGISKDYNVFELQKAIGNKDLVKIHRIINYFQENPKSNPMVLVVSNLYNYFTKLLVVKENYKLRDQELTGPLGMSPRAVGFVREYRNASNNFSFPQLQRAFESLAIADQRTKGVGVRSMTPKAILQEFMASII